MGYLNPAEEVAGQVTLVIPHYTTKAAVKSLEIQRPKLCIALEI